MLRSLSSVREREMQGMGVTAGVLSESGEMLSGVS
jgi:hypothetical protein